MSRFARARLRDQRGFTLIEMLVTIVVLSILAAAFATLFGSVARHSSTISDQMTLQVEARAALDRFAGDLRQAYSGDSATYPVENVTTNQIRLLTPDRAVPFHLRRVSYRITSNRLERAEAISTDTDGWPWVIPALGPYRTLVGSLTSPSSITFFDANGAPTTTAANVREIRIQITVRTPTGRISTHTETVTLRAGKRS